MREVERLAEGLACLSRTYLFPVTSEVPTSLVAWWSELLATSNDVPGWIPVLQWEIFLSGEDPHNDHGLSSLWILGLKPLLVHHAHIYHHSHHRGNVTAPYGRPNLRCRLHFGHNQEGGPRSLYEHVWLEGRRERERERNLKSLLCTVKPQKSLQ
jgi:hypothetical protein